MCILFHGFVSVQLQTESYMIFMIFCSLDNLSPLYRRCQWSTFRFISSEQESADVHERTSSQFL